MDKALNRPLRIGLYSPALPNSGSPNGIVTYTRIMRDALRELGHSVTVATTEAIERPDGRIAEVPKPNRLSRRLRMLTDKAKPDGAHPSLRLRVLDGFVMAKQHGLDVFEMEESFGWAGSLAGRGVPIIERLHGPHLYVRDEFETREQKVQGDLRQAAEHASFRQVQAVTAPTQRLLNAMALHGLDLTIARAIRNPMPLPAQKAWCLDSADPNQILFVGRFDACKGADVAIRAFEYAASLKPSLRLVVVGPDRGILTAEFDRIGIDEFLASEISDAARSRIQFLGELLPNQVSELRFRSAMVLVTSRFDNFPYSLTEAMALGMPVLASDCFGPAEIVENGVSGRLVPVDDARATGTAMLEMLGDNAKLRELGRGARERVATLLSPHRVARTTVDVYREAIARARAG